VYIQATTNKEKKVKIAASFLSSTANKWFIGAHLSSPFVMFDMFINVFKTRFTQRDNDYQLRIKVETITQEGCSPLEYTVEFQIILTDISEERTDMVWAHYYFEHGLDKRIQCQVRPLFIKNDTISNMAEKAQHCYEFQQHWQADNPRTPVSHNRTNVTSLPIQIRMPKSHP